MDLALEMKDGVLDLVVDNGQLRSSDALEAAVLLSWQCHARAPADIELPTDDGDRRGFWGDTFADIDGDQTGSLIWLAERMVQTNENAERVRGWAQAALAWMVQDGVAQRVQVEADNSVAEQLRLTARITRPDGVEQVFRYALNWAAQAA